ncbi:low affinity iron permease family protein [Thiobacillus sp.]
MSAINNGSRFSRFSQAAARMSGGPRAFMLALSIVGVWGLSGPLFDFNDTWQLVINTGTTIITFLMVFLIQNTQNRDTQAMQIKLDELIWATREAHNSLLDLEELEAEDLERIRARYTDLAKRARDELRSRPDVDTRNAESRDPGA